MGDQRASALLERETGVRVTPGSRDGQAHEEPAQLVGQRLGLLSALADQPEHRLGGIGATAAQEQGGLEQSLLVADGGDSQGRLHDARRRTRQDLGHGVGLHERPCATQRPVVPQPCAISRPALVSPWSRYHRRNLTTGLHGLAGGPVVQLGERGRTQEGLAPERPVAVHARRRSRSPYPASRATSRSAPRIVAARSRLTSSTMLVRTISSCTCGGLFASTSAAR